ncbi:MAG: phenylpyruvate tautomerase MIF-related protein [Oscillospiraceae bacterium]|nr:phenylpyruvate tautomerase MIF-related protein [Oscillospiraceae bacterium]
MPICQLKTNFRFNDAARNEFMNEIAAEMADIIEKPLPAIMVMLDDSHMFMNKTENTVFFAEFRYIKDFENDDEKKKWLDEFAERMLSLIQKYTNVDPYRIYMQFTEMSRESAWKYTPKN